MINSRTHWNAAVRPFVPRCPLDEIDLMVNKCELMVNECEQDVAKLSGAWQSAPETKRTDFFFYGLSRCNI